MNFCFSNHDMIKPKDWWEREGIAKSFLFFSKSFYMVCKTMDIASCSSAGIFKNSFCSIPTMFSHKLREQQNMFLTNSEIDYNFFLGCSEEKEIATVN